MTPFEAMLLGVLESFAWLSLSALLYWVTGSQWALLAILPAFVPWERTLLKRYGRKP